MPRTSRKAHFAFVVLLGCGGFDRHPTQTYTPPPVPSLESVAFGLLGSGKIAFERNGPFATAYHGTYVLDATAGSSVHIFDNEQVYGPAISPDGQRVTFTKWTGTARGYRTFVSRIDGTSTVEITSTAEVEGPPSWTTDGQKVVLAGGASGPVYNIYTESPVSSPADRIQLTHFTAPSGTITCPTIIELGGTIANSAQGMLAFSCVYGAEIDVLAANGSLSAAYVAPRPDPGHSSNVLGPQWSPDGSRLAFIEASVNPNAAFTVFSYALKAMNADGTNVTTLVTVPIPPAANLQVGDGWFGPNKYSLCWMPDGSRIVFSIPEAKTVSHLWVVRADGSALTQLTSAADVYDRSVSCSRS